MRFLFCTDGHLSSKRPIARAEKTDSEYINNQLVKRKQMLDYALNNQIGTIVDGGDFLQYWRMDNSSELVIKVYDLFSKYRTVRWDVNIGNHDLPYHDLANIDKSLLGIFDRLDIANPTESIDGEFARIQFIPYGKDLGKVEVHDTAKIKVLVIHENIFEHHVPPYMTGYTAGELMALFPRVQLFLCGHNHEQFIITQGNQTVVNGGSIMRLTTKQKDYKPQFYDITIEQQIAVKPIPFAILPNMISTDHLKSNKIQTFVESTQEFADGSEVFDFRRDVEVEMNKRKTTGSVRNVVEDCLGDLE